MKLARTHCFMMLTQHPLKITTSYREQTLKEQHPCIYNPFCASVCCAIPRPDERRQYSTNLMRANASVAPPTTTTAIMMPALAPELRPFREPVLLFDDPPPEVVGLELWTGFPVGFTVGLANVGEAVGFGIVLPRLTL